MTGGEFAVVIPTEKSMPPQAESRGRVEGEGGREREIWGWR